MSESDDDTFGPLMPQESLLPALVGSGTAAPMQNIRDSERSEKLVKRLRHDDEDQQPEFRCVVQPLYNRAYHHDATVVDVVWLLQTVGCTMVTADARGRLCWFVKLPRGLFLAKVSEPLCQDDADPHRFRFARCNLTDTALLVDSRQGTVRHLNAELMELWSPVQLPWDVAAMLPDQRWLLTSVGRRSVLLLFSQASASVSIADVSTGTAASDTPVLSVSTSTLSPVRFACVHPQSGLVVVADTNGILDYAELAEDAITGCAVWRVLRGLDDTKKSRAAAPGWAKHVAFSSRSRTDFYCCFRAKLSPVDMKVSEASLVLAAAKSGAETCCSVTYFCLAFKNGKLLATYTDEQFLERPLGVGESLLCDVSCLVEPVNSAARKRARCCWLLPHKKPTGASTEWSVVAFCQSTAQSVQVLKGSAAVMDSRDGQSSHAFGPVAVTRTPVQATQHLRNYIARSPLGSGLGLDAISSFLGSSQSTNSEDVMLCAADGLRLNCFAFYPVAEDARRDFACTSLSAALHVPLLQAADAEAPATSPQGDVVATMHVTGYPPLVFRLFPFVAPLAVENFKRLCDAKFYDGLTLHRVIQDFMVQGGCPKGDGTGGKCLVGDGSPFPDEFFSAASRLPPHPVSEEAPWDSIAAMRVPYLFCMANAGPNTNESQFFVTTAATPWLKGKHTVFGVLARHPSADTSSPALADMKSTLRALESVAVDRECKPKQPLVIESIRVDVVLESP